MNALIAPLLALSPGVRISLGGIFGILALASSTQVILARLKPHSDFTELRSRIRSWWVIAGVFCLALVLNNGFSIAFFGLISFLAFKEYLSLIPTRRADRRILLWAYLTIPVQYWLVHIRWYGMFVVFIPVYAFLLLPMRMVLIGETKGFLRAAGTLHWGIMTTVFSLSHMAFLLVLPPAGSSLATGAGLVLYLVMLTELNDVAQFIWGKSLGRHAILPTVSPKKTWEGLLGGAGTTVIVAVLLAPLLTPFSRPHALAAGLVIGFGGFLGDVVVSALKRDLGVKDSGSTIPGHGGILDRVDSLTFTAPLFFHISRYLYF